MNIELKLENQQDLMGTVENINIRILIEGDKSRPITMTIEMISENDLFFNYFSKIDESIYF